MWTRASKEIVNREEELELRIERLEKRLLNSQRDLDAFLYAVSHDIRGPLRSILATGVILKEDFGEKLGNEGLSEIERQSNSARKIATILESILKLSRLGREEMRPTPVDLSALAAAVGGEAVVASAKTTILDIEPQLCVVGDPRHLRLMLMALFENAIKFASCDRTPQIRFGRTEDAFFVGDNGIGFDPAQAERIFKPFEKLNHDDDYPGAGIGLSLVRMVVSRHEGEVWAEGIPGVGATFLFTLP